MNRARSAVCQSNWRIALTGLVAISVVAILGASPNPAMAETDWGYYYQFRHSSALPGNLFGVSPEGQVGFAGALQQNIPVAYTPCQGNWVGGGNSGSQTGDVEIDWGGPDVNGTAFLGVGLGKPGHGTYFSWMATGTDIAEVYNIQFQIAPESADRPAVAVGVQDILNQQQRYMGIPYGARSIYAVTTGKMGGPRAKTYFTLGWGGGRFDSGVFGGVSLPLGKRLTVTAEYDGLNINSGAALSLLGDPAGSDWQAIGYFGMADLDRPIVGLAITRH